MSVSSKQSGDEAEAMDFAGCIAANGRTMPDKPALVLDGRVLTWGEFTRDVHRTAHALHALGVGKGDKVAMLAATSMEYVTLFAGAVVAGACAVPLSAMMQGEAVEMMIRDCDARVLAVSRSTVDQVEPFAGRLDEILPGGFIGLDCSDERWRDFHAWIAEQPDSAPGIEVEPDDPFDLIYSSGTTGTPKGILHPHAMRAGHLQRMGRFGLGEEAITLVSTPLYSNTTLVAMLPTLAGGGTAVLMRKFDVAEFLRLAQDEKVTHAMLVPVQYQRILAHPDFGRYDLSSFRAKLSTSAPLRRSVIEDANRRWPGELIEIYGLTEGGVTTILNTREFPDKLDTVGRPSETVEMLLVDEQGRPVPQGEIGEVVGRSHAMMTGYYKRPEQTRALIWKDENGRVFYRTGDMGRLDEDGFLQLLDRKKDMIISGGFNIYATDLEQMLLRHAAVLDAAVIGVSSERWGETPVALVVLAEGADLSEESLREWANERLGKAQRLSAVQFIDSLPRSTIGKVLKRELRETYLRRNQAKTDKAE